MMSPLSSTVLPYGHTAWEVFCSFDVLFTVALNGKAYHTPTVSQHDGGGNCHRDTCSLLYALETMTPNHLSFTYIH